MPSLKKECPTIPHRNPTERLAFGTRAIIATRGQPVISHCGPYFYDAGSLTASYKDDVFKKTGVSVNIRERKQWNFQRGLAASGPPQGVEEALFSRTKKSWRRCKTSLYQTRQYEPGARK